MNIKEINQMLNNDKLPSCLDFSLENQMKQNANFNWESVAYQTFYKSYDYCKSKFDEKLLDLIGEEEVMELQDIMEKTSPLEQYNEIKDKEKELKEKEFKDKEKQLKEAGFVPSQK